jgi:hypothetical protein
MVPARQKSTSWAGSLAGFSVSLMTMVPVSVARPPNASVGVTV